MYSRHKQEKPSNIPVNQHYQHHSFQHLFDIAENQNAKFVIAP
jgi:hypothetical protein